MSKSLGNSPDPIELMNQFGADGVRVGMLLTSPASNDLPFDEKLCEQGRNFANKIWNAFRLTQSWEVDADRKQPESAEVAVRWMKARVQRVLEELEGQFAEFRLSEALMNLYRLVWDDFCSWYLELVKPPYGEPIDAQTLEQTKAIFGDLLKMLHPFMPFQTEELWHWMEKRGGPEDALCIAAWPDREAFDGALLAQAEAFQQIVSEVRNIRKENQIPNREQLELSVQLNDGYPEAFESAIIKLSNVDGVARVADKSPTLWLHRGHQLVLHPLWRPSGRGGGEGQNQRNGSPQRLPEGRSRQAVQRAVCAERAAPSGGVGAQKGKRRTGEAGSAPRQIGTIGLIPSNTFHTRLL